MMKVLFFWIYKKKIFCYFFEIKAVFKLIIAYIYSKKKIKKKIEYYHLPFVPLFQDIRRTMGRGLSLIWDPNYLIKNTSGVYF